FSPHASLEANQQILVCIPQFAHRKVKSGDGSARSDGLVDKRLDTVLIQTVEQLTSKFRGSVLQETKQLKERAIVLNQVQKALRLNASLHANQQILVSIPQFAHRPVKRAN